MSKPVEEIKKDVERRYTQLEQIQATRKQRKELLKDALLNDPTYIALEQSAQKIVRELRLHREMLLNEPEYQKLLREEKEDAAEMRELRAMLTGDLFNYTRETDSFQIETGDELHNIQYKAKLVKTNQPTLI